MSQYTIADLLDAYEESLKSSCKSIASAKASYDQTLTSLTRYTLPGWGVAAPKGRKPTKDESEKAMAFLRQAPIERMNNALIVQDKVFESVNATKSQRYTYRCKLKSIIKFAQDKGFLFKKGKTTQNRCPQRRLGYLSEKEPITTRKWNSDEERKFILQKSDISDNLKNQLSEIKLFMISPYYQFRKIDPIRESTADSYMEKVHRMLGWWKKYRNATNTELTLELLIPKSDHTESGEYIEEWICDFKSFLKSRNLMAYSINTYMNALLWIAKFQYRKEAKDKKYTNIEAVRIVRNHFLCNATNTERAYNEEAKWLDLPNVFSDFVNPLRQECEYRTRDGKLRKTKTIGGSFQIYIIAAMLTYSAPRRQQEFRELKISLSCDIKPPKGLKIGQVIHPLPKNRNEEKKFGYLYKSIDGKWYRDVPKESYKTGDKYGSQTLEIVNKVFPDGRCFYDYLEAFIYGYWRDTKGNWISGGSTTQAPGITWNLLPLRFALEPSHNFVFTSTRKDQPFDRKNLTSYFGEHAYRLTKKRLTPHLLRNIYATYFLDKDYSKGMIDSLAYAMAQSPEVLRAAYDRRKSHQKLRPIKEEMETILKDFIQ